MRTLPYLPDILRGVLLCVAGDYHTCRDCDDDTAAEEKRGMGELRTQGNGKYKKN